MGTIYIVLHMLASVVYQTHAGKEYYSPNNAPKSVIHQLRSDLLKNYDKGARPFGENKNVTEIYFSFYPQYVLDLDEENHILSLEAWITMHWTDKHLSWDTTKYSGLYALQFSPYEIWTPDITIYSSKPVDYYNPLNMNSDILSFNDGAQVWVSPASIRTYCDLDYSHYPLDVQQCKIVFGSWSHHDELMYIYLSEGDVYFHYLYNTNHMWEVTRSTIKKVIKYYSCCQERYVTVEANINLRRKQPSIPSRTLRGPSLLSVSLVLLMFWLPSSYQKIILGCTSLIVSSICLFYIGKATASSNVIIITANSVHSLLYITTTALLVEIIIVSMARQDGLCRLPATVSNFLHNRIAVYLLIKVSEKECGLIEAMDSNSDDGSLEYSRDYADDWLILSIALDRMFFLVYGLAFITYFGISGL